MFNPSRILILAPHTDDGELGCGGSIAGFIASGREVYYAALSTCAKALPPDLPADTLSHECRDSNKILGVKDDHVILFDFEVRQLLVHRQQILEELLSLHKKIQPDLVFLPARNDIHQDHQVVHAEGVRAFKNCNVLGYELPWNNTRFQPNHFQIIKAEELSKKTEALKMYRSQAGKNYMHEDFIRSLARVRGVQANAEYAEAFELYKQVVTVN